MLRIIFTFVLISAALAQQPAAELVKLAPSTVRFEEDGILTDRICFNGERWRVLLSKPPGWDLSGTDSTVLTLHEDRDATIALLNPRVAVLPLDTEEKLKAVRATILATAPRDAEQAEIVEETPDAIPINGWKSHQFTLVYAHFGQKFRRVVTFIKINPVQEIQVVTFAPESLAARTADAANQLLNSWYREPLAAKAASAAKD